MTTVTAIYENGVLRPTERLPFHEGESVEVTVLPKSQDTPPQTPDEWTQRVQAAKTIDEWAALANACPDPDDGYDVIKELNSIRRANGERLLTREDQL